MPKKWTPKEEKFLLKNYGEISNKELAERFGVSTKAVANKAHALKAAILPPEKLKPKKKKTSPTVEETIVPLSTITKKKGKSTAKIRKPSKTEEPEQPPELIPTTMMIMTADGWKPIKIDKRKIQS
jgi:transposase